MLSPCCPSKPCPVCVRLIWRPGPRTLDAGAPPERLCKPLLESFQSRGGELHYNARLKSFVTGEDGGVTAFELADGRKIEGDLFVSAMSGADFTFTAVHTTPLSAAMPVRTRRQKDGPTNMPGSTSLSRGTSVRPLLSRPISTSGRLLWSAHRAARGHAQLEEWTPQPCFSKARAGWTPYSAWCPLSVIAACLSFDSGRGEAADTGGVEAEALLQQAGQADRPARHQRPHLVRLFPLLSRPLVTLSCL